MADKSNQKLLFDYSGLPALRPAGQLKLFQNFPEILVTNCLTLQLIDGLKNSLRSNSLSPNVNQFPLQFVSRWFGGHCNESGLE